jgi:pimeloyl-ACP methyl ester carboxylesterase
MHNGTTMVRIIDWLEERAARRDDDKKRPSTFVLDAASAFGETGAGNSLSEFLAGARRANADSAGFYSLPPSRLGDFTFDGKLLRFASPLATDVAVNNTVYARLYERDRRRAVVILHHWNAPAWEYSRPARLLSLAGFSVLEVMLPHHAYRSTSGAAIADEFVSANLGRTIRSVRQAVLDTRKAVDWLTLRGYRHISLVGVSMGSCIAGLVAAHDRRIEATALLLTAGSFADVVWTSRATRHIQATLAAHVTLPQLREAWAPISSGTFAPDLARSGHRILVLSGRHDRVAPPALTQDLCRQLARYCAEYQAWSFGCGHHLMGRFPFSVAVLWQLTQFLRHGTSPSFSAIPETAVS